MHRKVRDLMKSEGEVLFSLFAAKRPAAEPTRLSGQQRNNSTVWNIEQPIYSRNDDAYREKERTNPFRSHNQTDHQAPAAATELAAEKMPEGNRARFRRECVPVAN